MSSLKDPRFPVLLVVSGREDLLLSLGSCNAPLTRSCWSESLPSSSPSAKHKSGGLTVLLDRRMRWKIPLLRQSAVHLLGAKLSSLWAPRRGSGIDCTAAWAYLKVKVNSCCRKRARNCICCNICSCLFFLSAADLLLALGEVAAKVDSHP